jgi:hypothetical protein
MWWVMVPPRRPAAALAAALLAPSLATVAACRDRAGPPPPAASPGAPSAGAAASVAEAPPPGDWPPLPAAGAARLDEDGVPIIDVVGPADGARAGSSLEPISGAWKTLKYPWASASDGVSTFVAFAQNKGTYSDVVVRGGRLYLDALAALAGSAEHPGGCAAAAGGTLLLSAPRKVAGGRGEEQVVWRVGPAGRVEPLVLPREAGSDRDCRALLEPSGRFALFASNLALYDGGGGFTVERGWSRHRTHLTSLDGPRVCFEHCNAQEHSAEGDAAVAALKGALGGCPARFTGHGKWLAARCGRRAARLTLGGAPEVVDDLPEGKGLADGMAFTPAGDLVLELELAMRRYVVWPAGRPRPSPARTLGPNQVISRASPAVLVRGLPEAPPAAVVTAYLLGDDVAHGANGGTYGYQALDRRTPAAHAARTARARAVLPAGRLAVAHEAVVDLECGAYVRSPLGWEGVRAHDWTPPVLPPLSPRAVYRPAACLPLAAVDAVPGLPDALLAKTRDGRLALAWLPPPLPLPPGSDPRRSEPPARPLAQRPRPGSGWTLLGPVDDVDGVEGRPEPGADEAQRPGSWQAGGGAIVRAGGATLLVTPGGAWALPEGTRPMAVEATTPRAYGARGTRLVVCDQGCRTLDPGTSGRAIVAVVPRTRDRVIVGLEGGSTWVYRVPEAGGELAPDHPLAAALRGAVKSRPRSAGDD